MIVGPTGSGKSSTMYTLIRELLSDRTNLITLEDPVEYHIKGATQVQINEKSQELADLQEQVETQKIKNEDMKHALNADEEETKEYIERVAREDLDYAKPGERVFVNIAGD